METATTEVRDGGGGGGGDGGGLKTGLVAVWWFFGLVFGPIVLGWVGSCRLACLSWISGCGLPMGVGWSGGPWVMALVALDWLWVVALGGWINGCFFLCVFGGESSGGVVAMVWWVWCKKVYSMVVFGMGLLGCF